ncbi:MAG: hypothetical protein ACLTDA_03075, partial [[Eubacterium] siraeum]
TLILCSEKSEKISKIYKNIKFGSEFHKNKKAGSKEPACKPLSTQKRKTASLQPLLRYAVSHDGKKSKNVR